MMDGLCGLQTMVLRETDIQNMEVIVHKNQLCWTEFLVWVINRRILKQMLYSELVWGKCLQQKPLL